VKKGLGRFAASSPPEGIVRITTERRYWTKYAGQLCGTELAGIVTLLEIDGNLLGKSAISGSSDQLPPLPKRLASKFFHGATGRKVAIDVEEVIEAAWIFKKR